jgi:hypothetical protein
MGDFESKLELGKDLIPSDNLLDGVTFDDLILAVHCGCESINRDTVKTTMKEIMAQRREDMTFLLEKNMDAIIAQAMKGRGE